MKTTSRLTAAAAIAVAALSLGGCGAPLNHEDVLDELSKAGVECSGSIERSDYRGVPVSQLDCSHDVYVTWTSDPEGVKVFEDEIRRDLAQRDGVVDGLRNGVLLDVSKDSTRFDEVHEVMDRLDMQVVRD